MGKRGPTKRHKTKKEKLKEELGEKRRVAERLKTVYIAAREFYIVAPEHSRACAFREFEVTYSTYLKAQAEVRDLRKGKTKEVVVDLDALLGLPESGDATEVVAGAGSEKK